MEYILGMISGCLIGFLIGSAIIMLIVGGNK